MEENQQRIEPGQGPDEVPLEDPRGVEIDWVAYFRAFSEAHGGSPVQWGKKLLFRDGWSYSGLNHHGPEWRPPEDEGELKGMKVLYWSSLREELCLQWESLKETIDALRELQRSKSMPILVRGTTFGGPSGDVVVHAAVPMRLTEWEGSLASLGRRMEEASTQLNALEKK